MNRPKTTVVLAMSADGKVSDTDRNPPEFSSKRDYLHLEEQVAQSDAAIFGAGTLRAGGSALRVQRETLVQMRQAQGKPKQPVQVVCTRSGDLDRDLKFFEQSIPRWMLTTQAGAQSWKGTDCFEQVLDFSTDGDEELDWPRFFEFCTAQNIQSIAVLGGGSLIAALLAKGYIDELWLTVCPTLLGGSKAPTPVDGDGLSQDQAPELELIETRRIGDELFLHYRVKSSASEG